MQDISLLLSAEGAAVQLPSGSDYTIRATPAATGSPTVWVLGSSENSARLAASLGMPYVFANHFAGDGLKSAMESYRTTYQPSAAHPEPRTFLTVNVVAAPTAEEAEERVQPQLRVFARMLTGRPPQALETVEQALAAPADAAMDQATQTLGSRWMVGTGETVATELREFAERNAVEEVSADPENWSPRLYSVVKAGPEADASGPAFLSGFLLYPPSCTGHGFEEVRAPRTENDDLVS